MTAQQHADQKKNWSPKLVGKTAVAAGQGQRSAGQSKHWRWLEVGSEEAGKTGWRGVRSVLGCTPPGQGGPCSGDGMRSGWAGQIEAGRRRWRLLLLRRRRPEGATGMGLPSERPAGKHGKGQMIKLVRGHLLKAFSNTSTVFDKPTYPEQDVGIGAQASVAFRYPSPSQA